MNAQNAGWARFRTSAAGETAYTTPASANVTTEMALDRSIDVRRRCRSTNVPKNMPDTAMSSM